MDKNDNKRKWGTREGGQVGHLLGKLHEHTHASKPLTNGNTCQERGGGGGDSKVSVSLEYHHRLNGARTPRGGVTYVNKHMDMRVSYLDHGALGGQALSRR
jgi:hypothetical protein